MTLQTERVRTLEQVRAFVEGTEPVDFAGAGRGGTYALVRRTLVRLDTVLGQTSGPATRAVLRRQWEVFGDARFERLSELSNGHLYNLRKSRSIFRTRRSTGQQNVANTG